MVDLPVSRAAREANSPEADAAEPDSRVSEVTVLLVEDDADSIFLIRNMIAQQGYQLCCVTDGQQAVDACAQQQFDLILMDLKMTRMDGLEAARHIRKQERETGRHTPIVALTACAFDADREASLDAGMDDWIAKPVSYRELQRIMADCLDQDEQKQDRK
jgi:CheY-like chemotaxis protein